MNCFKVEILKISMKFTEFDITNFKGVPKLTIDFNKVPHPNIYTLVGLNESGKTSILEAIDFFGNGWNKEYFDFTWL